MRNCEIYHSIESRNMKLHILRHAKTEDTSHSEKDVDRRLHAQGIDQAKTLRGFFESITSLDEIWCSNAQRTRQTSEIVLQNFVHRKTRKLT